MKRVRAAVRAAFLAFVPVFLAFVPAAQAQVPLALPDGSPKAAVSQTVGLSEFTVNYHRPAVNKRKIWGGLVPYGDVWRAGANENTTLAASTPFTFGGKAVPAGTYGLHMLPSEGRVDGDPERAGEGLGKLQLRREGRRRPRGREARARRTSSNGSPTRSTSPRTDATALALRWEKLRVAVPITVDTKAVTLASIRDQLRGLPRFSWQGWNQAANWCARNDVTTDEALAWADRSLSMQKTFANLRTKALLVEKKGDVKAAAALRAEALPLATEGGREQPRVPAPRRQQDGRGARVLPQEREGASAVVERLGQPRRGSREGRRHEGRARELRESARHGSRGSEEAHQRGDREAEVGRSHH